MTVDQYYIWDIAIKIIEALALIVGGSFALYKYRNSVENNFRKPLWEKQLALYFAASEAAAILATSQDEEKRKQAEADFWQLYYGPLAVVEDAGAKKPEESQVEAAMVKFGKCLNGEDVCSKKEIHNRSLTLAHSIRDSIGKSWDVKLADLKGKYNR
jgi:hypothetical protein